MSIQKFLFFSQFIQISNFKNKKLYLKKNPKFVRDSTGFERLKLKQVQYLSFLITSVDFSISFYLMKLKFKLKIKIFEFTKNL